MDKFDLLLQELKDAEIIQTQLSWEDNIPEEIWDEYFKPHHYKKVADVLDIDVHRWYELSTTVVQVYSKRFLGIRLISKVYSTSMSVTDCEHEIEFFEMKAVSSITYIPI